MLFAELPSKCSSLKALKFFSERAETFYASVSPVYRQKRKRRSSERRSLAVQASPPVPVIQLVLIALLYYLSVTYDVFMLSCITQEPRKFSGYSLR